MEQHQDQDDAAPHQLRQQHQQRPDQADADEDAQDQAEGVPLLAAGQVGQQDDERAQRQVGGRGAALLEVLAEVAQAVVDGDQRQDEPGEDQPDAQRHELVAQQHRQEDRQGRSATGRPPRDRATDCGASATRPRRARGQGAEGVANHRSSAVLPESWLSSPRIPDRTGQAKGNSEKNRRRSDGTIRDAWGERGTRPRRRGGPLQPGGRGTRCSRCAESSGCSRGPSCPHILAILPNLLLTLLFPIFTIHSTCENCRGWAA